MTNVSSSTQQVQSQRKKPFTEGLKRVLNEKKGPETLLMLCKEQKVGHTPQNKLDLQAHVRDLFIFLFILCALYFTLKKLQFAILRKRAIFQKIIISALFCSLNRDSVLLTMF